MMDMELELLKSNANNFVETFKNTNFCASQATQPFYYSLEYHRIKYLNSSDFQQVLLNPDTIDKTFIV